MIAELAFLAVFPVDLPPRIAAAVHDAARRVRAHFGDRVLQVELFGSHARGQGSSESDVDLFVRVADLKERERGELFDLAADVSIEHLVTLQIFAPIPAEYEWITAGERGARTPIRAKDARQGSTDSCARRLR